MNSSKEPVRKIAVFFPKDSESIFNKNCSRTFGGASVQMLAISQAITKYSKSIELFSIIPRYNEINFDNENNFNLIMPYKENDTIYKKIFKVIWSLLKIKPEVVIQQGLTIPSVLLSLFCYIKKIKYVFLFAHDVEANGCYQKNNKKCLFFFLLIKLTSLLIVQNKYQLNQLVKLNKKYNNKFFLLYSGFPLKPRRNKFKKNILWVARSEKWKNPELFINLAQRNRDLKFIMICSNNGNNEYFESLKKTASAFKNLKFIDFVQLDEIDQYFKDAGLLINTSDYEGYPQVFIHAALNSIPILSLKVDPDNFITNYNCGIVCNNDFELLNASVNIILNNKKKYKKLSDNIYDYNLEKHDIKKNINLLLDRICSIV